MEWKRVKNGINIKMLAPYFEKSAIFCKKTIFWLQKLIFHIFQGKGKFRSFQRFSCSFHIRAQNSFQSWQNLIFCPHAKHFYTGLVYFLKFSPGWVSKNRFSPGWNIFGVNPPGWEYKGKYWPGWEFWGKISTGVGKKSTRVATGVVPPEQWDRVFPLGMKI